MGVMLISAYVVFILALMSPGPDFAITVRNSVRHGRACGVATALGIALANLVHISYVTIGLGALIARSLIAFTVLKYLAAAYLVWIGVKALRSRPISAEHSAPLRVSSSITRRDAFLQGLLTNVLNPKAAVFWLSYLTIVLDPHMSRTLLLGFMAVQIFSVYIWFSLVAHVMSRARVRQKFLQLGHWFDRVTGAVLVALGVKVALLAP